MMHSKLICSGICLAAVFLAATLARAQSPSSAAEDKNKPVQNKKRELSLQSNDDLLKQANAIHDKALSDYLAQLRILATAEAQLDSACRQTEEVRLVAATAEPVTAQKLGEKSAEKAVESARAQQQVVRRALKLTEAQKALLGRTASAIDACQSAAAVFQNALDDLQAYAQEARLRVQDRSLAGNLVPDSIKEEYLYKMRGRLRDDLVALKRKADDTQRGQENVARLLDEAAKTALACDARVVEATKNLARQMRRHDLEKAYTGKKVEELAAELERMVEEGIGLKGTYELALHKIDGRMKDAARLRRDFEEQKPPQVKIPQLNRAEDVEKAAKSIQGLIDFYGSRLKMGEGLRAALTALSREGSEFEADASVSDEHLFQMQVLTHLLHKQGVADMQLPEKARAAALNAAGVRQQQSAAAVRAAADKAASEIAALDRQMVEAHTARDAATKQLDNLKDSRDVLFTALKWENQLRTASAAQVIQGFVATRTELADRLVKLKAAADSYRAAALAVGEARTRLDGVRDPFLRAAEEQGQAEKLRLSAELRKEAGLERLDKDGPVVPQAQSAETKMPAADKKPAADLDRTTEQLAVVQQLLAGRIRVLEEQGVRKKDLLTAQNDLEKKATAYLQALAEARLDDLRLNAAAVELKKRFGLGEIASEQIPDGITEALRREQGTQLGSKTAAVLNSLDLLQQERDKLLRPDPAADTLATATGELLTLVGSRLDLIADWKRLAADYRREPSARPPSELKRVQQLAAERQARESSGWDSILGIDSSKASTSLAELLDAHYQELIEIEDKEENIKKQREKVEQILELSRKEAAAIARALPMLAKQVQQLEAAREEDTVLARARLRPDQADELLKAYQARTGRLLTKPLPFAEKHKAEKVEQLSNLLFERHVTLEAAKRWNETLSNRLAATGIKAEAGVYQDELTQMQAVSAANARRVNNLVGHSSSSAAATAGEIGSIRAQMNQVRSQGVQRIGITILVILLAAFFLPGLLLWTLRRAFGASRGEEGSLMLTALFAIVKFTVWMSAAAVILNLLGINVTAIIAGLGIGGLAIGLAAQSMLADIIGAFVIFAERRFKIGDVIRLDRQDPVRIAGLTWRSTQVKNAEGMLVTIPNRKVTEAVIENLTRAEGTYDGMNVSVTTSLDAGKVLATIQHALTKCRQLIGECAMSVVEFNQKGDTRKITYHCSWLTKNYDARNETRDEVFDRISAILSHEELAGAEISLA